VLSEKVTALESKLDKIMKMMSASTAFAAVAMSDSEDEGDDEDDDEDEDSDEDEEDSDDYDDDDDEDEDEDDEDVPAEEEADGMQDQYKSWLHEHVLERSSGEGWGCDGRRQHGGCKQGWYTLL